MARAERSEPFIEAVTAGRVYHGEAPPSANDNEAGRPQPDSPPCPPVPSALQGGAFATIEQQGRSANQSGRAREQGWRLRLERRTKPFRDPLTGWIGGSDPLAHLELRFPTREAAVRFAERHGLGFEVREARSRPHRPETKQAFQLEPPLSLCCWPTGPHALCCGAYPLPVMRKEHVR